MLSGIYKIECLPTGKVYIGSTNHFVTRWGNHKRLLRRGEHHNGFLQRAWAKYGEAAFRFSILEAVAVENLLRREARWMAAFCSSDRLAGFNMAETPYATRGMTVSAETKEKIAAKLRGHTYNLGRICAPETKAKISAAHKGRIITVEQRAKIAATLTGRTHGAEARANMSASKKGRPKPPGLGVRLGALTAFFSPEQVADIRALADAGVSRREIARRYGTSHNVVSKALDGRSPYYASLKSAA